MASDGILLGSNGDTGAAPEPKPVCRIVIDFEGPQAAGFTPRFEGPVLPGQKVEAGEWLSMIGKIEWQQLMAQAQQQALQQAQLLARLQGERRH